jgi:hypothetical protein
MAFFQGKDGSVRYSAAVVLQVKSWSCTTSIEELDTTTMGVAWKGVVGGQGSWQGQLTVDIDLAAASVQNSMATSLITATPAGTSVALELRVSPTKYFSGNALLKNMAIQDSLGQIVTLAFSFTGDGALAFAWT